MMMIMMMTTNDEDDGNSNVLYMLCQILTVTIHFACQENHTQSDFQIKKNLQNPDDWKA